MKWLKGSYIRKIEHYQGAFNVQNLLNKEGWFNITATPIGGDKVLLLAEHEETITIFYQKQKKGSQNSSLTSRNGAQRRSVMKGVSG